MTEVSGRLTRWVRENFGDEAESVLQLLRTLPGNVYGGQDPERIQACLVLPAAGRWSRVQAALETALLDWRDALVGGGLGNDDWPDRLDEVLGPRRS